MFKNLFITGLVLYSLIFQAIASELSPAAESLYSLSYSDFKNGLAKFNVHDVNCQDSLGSKLSENYQLGREELSVIAKTGYGAMKMGQLDEVLKLDKEKKSYFIPLGLSDKESLGLILAGSLGLVLFKNDEQLTKFTQDHKTKVTTKISKLGDLYGSALVPAISVGSYILGAVTKDDKIEQLGVFSLGALATQALIVSAVKVKTGRARPEENKGAYSFGNDGTKDKNQSFYSAHTAFAFTFAAVAEDVYGKENPVVPYVAYGIAFFVGLSRVHDRKHSASDVFMGGVAGKGLTSLYLNAIKGNPDNRSGLKITPLIGGPKGEFAIMAQWTEAEKNSVRKCKKSLEQCLADVLTKN